MKTKKKFTRKERKLVQEVIAGSHDTQIEAYESAGYSVTGNKNVDAVNASRTINKPHIQQAIDDALQSMGATPEWAVTQLMKVASQDEEIGAKRLAAKDILELHGWNKTDKPTLQLQVKNAFFSNRRNEEVIDVDSIEEQK